MLQRGVTLTLLDGRVIEPHQVMSPGTPGPLVMVVDLPTEAHLREVAGEAGPLAKWTVRRRGGGGEGRGREGEGGKGVNHILQVSGLALMPHAAFPTPPTPFSSTFPRL